MSTKSLKLIIFASLAVAVVLPLSVIQLTADEDQTTKNTIKIRIAELESTMTTNTDANVTKQITALKLMLESIEITESNELTLEQKHQKHAEIIEKLDKIADTGVLYTDASDLLEPSMEMITSDPTTFSFSDNHDSCWNWHYTGTTDGIIDTVGRYVGIGWNYPSNMWVGPSYLDCDNKYHEMYSFSLYGIESDATGIYFCTVNMPLHTFISGVFGCSYVSAGDIVTLSPYSDYEDGVFIIHFPQVEIL